jgi:hypothetical protein
MTTGFKVVAMWLDSLAGGVVVVRGSISEVLAEKRVKVFHVDSSLAEWSLN